MVLESSQNIQATTMALMSFDPEYFEVTLQGSSNSVASARSKVVMILDKYREQARCDSSITADVGGHMFYDNLLLNNFVETQNNCDSSKLSHMLNGPDPRDFANPNCQSNIQANWHPTQPDIDSSEDIECDSTLSPVTSEPMKLIAPSVCSAQVELEDESSCEEYILTDPRYSKKIEQALKLGYSEKQVMKALDKHGPECALNDLLSELIKLGASDVDPSRGLSLSPESDDMFSNDVSDFELRRQRLNVIRTESGESSSFSSSADLHRSSINDASNSSNLRDVIIDGSNVAMSHGKKVFSCKGIQIAVNWFKEQGHKNITAFVPQWRKEASRPDAPITDQEILSDLEKEGIVVFTPARRVKGRRVVCYDDRYVLKLAVETDGIVVSNDVYRDLVNEREDFRKVVEQRLLMYSFVNDRFMPPEDPLGRLGPTLENFLRKVPAEPTPKPQDCPYGKKCTYGNKCRFYHPERGFTPQKLITETLKEQADLKLQERATRLSEIAEKGKRSKQKLSRTKSLVPGEPQPVQAAGAGANNKQDKPKLTHSKSLVLPNKSSDYLNEPRKKLEEAELTAAMEKMSVQDNPSAQQCPKQVFPFDESDKITKTKTAALRSSPVLQKDVIMQPVTSGDNPTKNSFPLKSVNTNPSRSSPSHLTVPKPDPPERYLSGHLYLAKKLSDESVESSFFSEHTSSPSSTRTSSPIVPISKAMDQKQIPTVEAYSKNRQEGITNSFTFPPPFHPSQFNQQQKKYNSQTEHHDLENIPHLSIFDQGISQYSQRDDSTDTSPIYKHEGVDNALFTDYAYQKINPHSPDSGLYTSSESTLSPYQNRLEYPLQVSKTYPMYRAEDSLESPEHLNLQHAVSSVGNFKTAEDVHQILGRRASGFSASHFGEEQLMMKPQSVPALERSAAYQFGHSYNLNRQNSSSDPQMHTAGARELQDVLSPLFSPGDRIFRDQYSSSSQHCHNQQQQQQQQRQFEHQQRLQLQQQQQQDSLLLSSHLSKPRMGIWEEHASQPNLGHRSSIGTAAQSHYNPLQCPVPAHSTSHMSHFPATTGSPNMITAGTYSPNTHRYTHPLYPQQSPMIYPTQFDHPSPTNMFSQARRQSFPSHLSYQQPPVTHSNPVFGCTDHQQTMPTGQPTSMLFILPEDTPILPDDPRYTIYYHLSNIFGEQVVRRVMNLNPHEHNPDLICKRIIKYKEDRL